jgi:hypothetical protein
MRISQRKQHTMVVELLDFGLWQPIEADWQAECAQLDDKHLMELYLALREFSAEIPGDEPWDYSGN